LEKDTILEKDVKALKKELDKKMAFNKSKSGRLEGVTRVAKEVSGAYVAPVQCGVVHNLSS
jgi:hypothetical protein